MYKGTTMSRTRKIYSHSKFKPKNSWEQHSLHLCTMCGTRFCLDPINLNGIKSKNKCKGTYKERMYVIQDIDDDG